MARSDEKRETVAPGRRIRIVRAVTGETQRDVAAGTGLDHSFISLLESGRRSVSRDVARKFGEYFFRGDEDEGG